MKNTFLPLLFCFHPLGTLLMNVQVDCKFELRFQDVINGKNLANVKISVDNERKGISNQQGSFSFEVVGDYSKIDLFFECNDYESRSYEYNWVDKNIKGVTLGVPMMDLDTRKKLATACEEGQDPLLVKCLLYLYAKIIKKHNSLRDAPELASLKENMSITLKDYYLSEEDHHQTNFLGNNFSFDELDNEILAHIPFLGREEINLLQSYFAGAINIDYLEFE